MLFAETNVLQCSLENAINAASHMVDRRTANIENFFIFLQEKNYQAGNAVEKKKK